jgi:hypothetical protein
MGLVESGVKTVSKGMPKMISPKTHAIIDYAMAGSFLVGAALLARKHRRAAFASLACAVAELATAMITDYPGGVKPLISFRTHERVDGGLASIVGAMPLAMNFGDDREATFFRAHGIAIAAVTGLTQWENEPFSDLRERIA